MSKKNVLIIIVIIKFVLAVCWVFYELVFSVDNSKIYVKQSNLNTDYVKEIDMKDFKERILKVPSSNNSEMDLSNSKLKYFGEEKTVLAMKENIVYGVSGTRLFKSNDYMRSWYLIKDIAPDYPINIHLLDKKGAVMITNNANVYALDSLDNVKEANILYRKSEYECLYQGIDSYKDTVVFGDYALEDGKVRIYTSNDSGLNWSVSMELDAPKDVRHIHCVQFNPYNKKFYVTSGDQDQQVKWWEGDENGGDWKEIQGCTGQEYRTLNMIFTPDGSVIWGMDSVKSPKIFKAKLDSLTKRTEMTSIDQACWGIISNEDKLIAICSVEADKKDDASKIYVSLDGGKTWNVDISWHLEDKKDFGGFRSIIGPNNKGEYGLNVFNIKQLDKKTICTVIVK